jgi:hypothetical protein
MKLILFMLVFLNSFNFAQELNCRVTVNYESLPVINRDLLANFQQIVEDYMNSTRFTDSWVGNKIDCSFDIFITSASSEVNYNAQIVVTSRREIYKSSDKSLMMAINDGQWAFVYEKDQPLHSNMAIFEPLTGILNYYAYMIIGFEMDSWEKLGGSNFYRRAFDIVNLGASSRHSTGWEKNSSSYSRRGFVEDVMNEKYRPFRESFYDYHYGLDVYSQNKTIGQKRMAGLIETLENMSKTMSVNSVLLKVFFDAKHGEIIDKLADYPDRQIFANLKRLDPGHSLKYDEVLKRAD